jgi:hypothetical protein
MPTIGRSTIALAVVVAGVPAALAVWAAARTPSRIGWRAKALLAILGAWMWVSTSALVAVTEHWQDVLVYGQGYISVVFGYVGFALLAVAAWSAIDGRVGGRRGAWAVGSGIAVGLLVAFTFAGNVAVATFG